VKLAQREESDRADTSRMSRDFGREVNIVLCRQTLFYLYATYYSREFSGNCNQSSIHFA